MCSDIKVSASRWRCFPVGLRPPFKHLHREKLVTNILKQHVKEQRYTESDFMPDGTKIGVEPGISPDIF